MKRLLPRTALVACVVPFSLGVSFAAFGGQSTENVGEDIYRARCVACHAMGCNRRGPRLAGLIGRKVGSITDYPGYSDGLRNSNWAWTEERLDRWLRNSSKLIPGNRMAGLFVPIESAEARRRVIQYIKQGDTSLDLCGGSK